MDFPLIRLLFCVHIVKLVIDSVYEFDEVLGVRDGILARHAMDKVVVGIA